MLYRLWLRLLLAIVIWVGLVIIADLVGVLR